MLTRVFLAVAMFAAFSVHAGGAVHERVLENGLKVVVKEDHRAPILVSQVWYKVGGSYEPDGLTGVSHVLEHMMFKGTVRHSAGEFSRIIAANGGEENAFTSRDYTGYYQTLAKDRLEVSLELEADRMRNLVLEAEEFAKEVEVVKEERRLRTEDRPVSLAYEQFNALAYRASPYANPVVGWMNDLDNMTVDDLREWYRLWYAPNNATLVVVGDVEPEQVFALAERYFGPLKPEPVPVLKPLREPRQRGEVRATVRIPARNPYFVMGYKTPVIATAEAPWEPYALEMLAAVLDGGDSARLSRELVRGAGVAVSAGADYSAFSRLSGMLILSGIPAQGRSVADLEQALRQQVERLRNELVAESELERIRTQVIAEQVYDLDSIYNQAMQIGALETVGLGWELIDRYLQRLQQVTPEQVREVARKYLDGDNLTLTVLEPLPMETEQPVRPATGGRHAG
jgi:zinc protease